MNFQITWTPCANATPQRLLCPYFNNDAAGITSIVYNRTTMAGGVLVEGLSTVQSISSATLISIDTGSDIARPGFPTGSSIYISSCAALTTVSFPNLVSIGESLEINSCPIVTTVNFDSLQTLGSWCDDPVSGYYLLSFSFNSSLTSISLPSFVGFDDMAFVPYAGVQSTNNPALTTVSMPNFIPNNTIDVDFRFNALNQASVDHILARCVANPAFVSGTVKLNGGTNAAPSSGGLADAATLTGRGVLVSHN